MKEIKDNGGIVGAPSDAAQVVKDMADYVTLHKGGKGSIREFIDYIIEENK